MQPVQETQTNASTLPKWNLPISTQARFAGAGVDFERAARESNDFATKYRGRLAAGRRQAGERKTGEAVARYEALQDLLGRIMSFATCCTPAMSPIRRARNFTRMRATIDCRRLHEAAVLPARTQSHRRRDSRSRGRQHSPLAIGAPGSRHPQGKAFELDDKLEDCFHEKSVTGASSWNRLFDETIASCGLPWMAGTGDRARCSI